MYPYGGSPEWPRCVTRLVGKRVKLVKSCNHLPARAASLALGICREFRLRIVWPGWTSGVEPITDVRIVRASRTLTAAFSPVLFWRGMGLSICDSSVLASWNFCNGEDAHRYSWLGLPWTPLELPYRGMSRPSLKS